MIPKIVHCFWAGGKKTRLAERCLASWRRFALGWEIREWSVQAGVPIRIDGQGRSQALEDVPRFAWDAIAAKKWAMVGDWLRMRALRDEGGVYLDLDVELVRPLDALPAGEWVAGEWTAKGEVWMNPGSGLALRQGSPIAAGMLERYARLSFDPDREMMPWINESLRMVAKDLPVLAPEVMSPIGLDGKLRLTDRTVGIHRYAMSWASPRRKFAKWLSWHGFRPMVEWALAMRRRTASLD